jgi:DNA-binding CsgD family transcriptional regulator
MAREGIIDSIQGRRTFRRADGSRIEMHATGWAIRSSTGPDLGLWMASDGPSDFGHSEAGEEVVAAAHSRRAGSALDRAQVTLDHHWRIAHISSDADLVFGRPPAELLATSILELTHSDDLAALLFAFARATTGPIAGVQVRLRHPDGNWRVIQAAPTVSEGDGTSSFALAAVAEEESAIATSRSHASHLAEHLRRIAAQIEAAGILPPPVERAGTELPAAAGLSARQWEIASRLVGGDRVPTIAAQLSLSQSTVRNHLSAIFQKFDVHSQQELLALWRGGRKGPSGNKLGDKAQEQLIDSTRSDSTRSRSR